MGGAADGGIGPTGTAMEHQMHQPAATAGEQLSGNALMGPGQITAATGGDHQRASRAISGRDEYKEPWIQLPKGQLIGASQPLRTTQQ
jgi:hypothetical protein